MKKLLLIALVLVSSACHAGYQPFTLPFVTPAGVASQAQLDSAGYIQNDIASENIGLIAKIGSITAAIQATGSAFLGTDTKVLPFTTYRANIATNSYTTLSSIASFSFGNYVTIRGVNGRIYWVGNTSVATANAILGDFIDVGELIGFTVGSDTTGLWGSSAFITTTAASTAIRVWPTNK